MVRRDAVAQREEAGGVESVHRRGAFGQHLLPDRQVPDEAALFAEPDLGA